MFAYFEFMLAKLIKKSHLRALRDCSIHCSSKVCAGCNLINVEIGKHSDIGYDCIIVNTKIGNFVSMGSDCRIGGARHTLDWVSTSPVFNGNRDHLPQKFSRHAFAPKISTSIGSDVWIADSVFIKGGVTIGDGSVVGMGSVVTKDIPPYEIWAGNPARMIRRRFSEEICRDLLLIKWWDLPDEKIREKANLIPDVEAFISSFMQ